MIIANINLSAKILLSLSFMLVTGFLFTRISKALKLPNVTAYIIGGLLIGPHVLNLIPETIVDNMDFISDIALVFIAFGVGRFFKKDTLKENLKANIVISLFESLLAGLLVSLSMRYIFSLDWKFSLLLGAIATATAPASTIVTIQQYNGKGPFVNTLLQVIALDDVICIMAFSLAIAFINLQEGSNLSSIDMIMPILYNILALVLAFFFALVLSKLMTNKRSEENRLILAIAFLLGLAGLCATVNVSPLLSCMVFSAIYINITNDKKLYKQIESFSPPIFLLFFIVSGMKLDISLFASLGIIGIVYFFIRIIGKYLGAYLGARFVKSPKETRNYLGLALVPQAGVAIGLVFLAQRALPENLGNILVTIILSSSVLYELVGPASAKLALILSNSIDKQK